jgi:conjugal transfer pilus assembly protein TraE
MLSDIAHARTQSLLRQRNMLALTSVGLGLLFAGAASLVATREREVLLVPTIRTPLTISSSGISSEYLEFVTRDVALTLLNRSPEGLDYWMGQILGVADPASRGRLKAELMRIVEEQRGSEVAQAFVISKLEVDPRSLTSDVTGTLKTFVGAQVIASEERQFRFNWTYRGLRLALSGFSIVPPAHSDDTPAPQPTSAPAHGSAATSEVSPP